MPGLERHYSDSACFEFAKLMKFLINIPFIPLNTLCQLSDFLLVVFVKAFLHQEASLTNASVAPKSKVAFGNCI